MTRHRPRSPTPAVQPVPRTSSTCSSAASTATRTRSSARTRTTAASPSACSSRWRRRSSSAHGDGTRRPARRTSTRASGSASLPVRRRARTTGSRSTYDDGARARRRRPLPLPADARRDGPAPDQRGPPRAAVGGARRPRAPLRRRRSATRSPAPSFAVWAPSARGVRVKGDFNSWDGREHPMRQLGQLRRLGALRARRRHRHGVQVRRPRRRRRSGARRPTRWPSCAEVPPDTASKVFESSYTWGDEDWMAARPRQAAGRRADVGLRDAPRLVAAPGGDWTWERAGRRAAGATSPTSASPTSS